MAKQYYNFICYNCGYSWSGWSETPRCPKCYNRKVKVEEMEIPEYHKQPSKKIITDLENVQNNKKNMETTKVKEETLTEEEETEYSCGYCGETVEYGALYCTNCGERLLWEVLE